MKAVSFFPWARFRGALDDRESCAPVRFRPNRVQERLAKFDELCSELCEAYMAFDDEVTPEGRLTRVQEFLARHENLEHRIEFLEACLEELLSRSYDIDHLCREAEKLRIQKVEKARAREPERIQRVTEGQTREGDHESLVVKIERAIQAEQKTIKRLITANARLEKEMVPIESEFEKLIREQNESWAKAGWVIESWVKAGWVAESWIKAGWIIYP